MRALVVGLSLLAGCAHGNRDLPPRPDVVVQPSREPVWILRRMVRVPSSDFTLYSERTGHVLYSLPETVETLWVAKHWDDMTRMLGEETTWTAELLAAACRASPCSDEARTRVALLVNRSWQARETWTSGLGGQHWSNMRATDGALTLDVRCGARDGECAFELRRDRVLVIGWTHHRWPEDENAGRWRSTTAWFGDGASVEVGGRLVGGSPPRAILTDDAL